MAAPLKSKFFTCVKLCVSTCRVSHRLLHTSQRNLSSKDLKKFYRKVSVTQSDGLYDINLDKRKLKTPGGKLFQVPNEALALAVATEWDTQRDTIKRHAMHLTTLVNTAIDNPTHRKRETVVNGILEFLATDTICYRVEDPIECVRLQQQHWDPLVDWVKARYAVDLEVTSGIMPPVIPEATKHVYRQHLLSFNDWALVGYQHIVESLKSLIITSALVDRLITVGRAVSLSRLETEFQIEHWGSVEYAHGVELVDTRARVAAGTLMVHLVSESSNVKQKQNLNQQGIV